MPRFSVATYQKLCGWCHTFADHLSMPENATPLELSHSNSCAEQWGDQHGQHEQSPQIAPLSEATLQAAQQLRSVLASTSPGGHRYVLQGIVGSGASGSAVVAKRVSDGRSCIIKMIDSDSFSDTQLRRVYEEVVCLMKCDYFGVVGFYDFFEAKGVMAVVMEYADAGDMGYQISQRRKSGVYFQEHEALLMVLQLVLALHHVHDALILHRDIKPSNLLVMSNGIAKLGDFGLSRRYDETVSNNVGSSFVGTPYYVAPEIYRQKPYSKKADIWSLGVTAFELLSLHRPFVGKGFNDVMQSVLSYTIESMPAKVTSEARELVASMLQPDPEQRPNTLALLLNPLMVYSLHTFINIVRNMPPPQTAPSTPPSGAPDPANDTGISPIPTPQGLTHEYQDDVMAQLSAIRSIVIAKQMEMGTRHARRIFGEKDGDSITVPVLHKTRAKRWRHRQLSLLTRATPDGSLTTDVVISRMATEASAQDNSPISVINMDALVDVVPVPKAFAAPMLSLAEDAPGQTMLSVVLQSGMLESIQFTSPEAYEAHCGYLYGLCGQ